VNVSYTFADWRNAGFNRSVTQSDEDLPDITKHSMGIVIRYWY